MFIFLFKILTFASRILKSTNNKYIDKFEYLQLIFSL